MALTGQLDHTATLRRRRDRAQLNSSLAVHLIFILLPLFSPLLSSPPLLLSLKHARRSGRAIFWYQYHPRRFSYVRPRIPQ